MHKYIFVLLFCSLFAGTQETKEDGVDIKVNNVILKSIGNTDLITPKVKFTKVKFNGIARLDLIKMCKEQPNHIWCTNNK